jgi:alpha/beta superfamily hydrolase
MGGDMHNPVVDCVYRAATNAGLEAHRFDFSSSVMTVAVAEATKNLDELRTPIVVVGYSFGALVAAQLTDDRIAAWVLVAPPFGTGSPSLIGIDARPKLILSPSNDQFCAPDMARAQTAAWRNTTVEAVAGADHFLAGGLAQVATRALEFAAATGEP